MKEEEVLEEKGIENLFLGDEEERGGVQKEDAGEKQQMMGHVYL